MEKLFNNNKKSLFKLKHTLSDFYNDLLGSISYGYLPILVTDENGVVADGAPKALIADANDVDHNAHVIEELLSQQATKNIYIAPNIFTTPTHRASNVAWFTSLYVDVDNTTYSDVEARIKQFNLPDPTLILNSGTGVHVYWVFNIKVRANSKNSGSTYGYTFYYLQTLKLLSTLLKGDPHCVDVARVLRMPLSYNANKDCKTGIIYYNPSNKYDFKTDFLPLAKAYLEDEPSKPSRKRAVPLRKSNPDDQRTGYNNKLLEDVKHLIEYRVSQGHEFNGSRHGILLSVAGLGATPSTINYINSLFDEPLNSHEVDYFVNYNFEHHLKRSTVFTSMNPTIDELKAINAKYLLPEGSVEFSKYITASMQELESMYSQTLNTSIDFILNKLVKKQMHNGVSSKKIASMYGLTDRHVRRIKGAKAMNTNETIEKYLTLMNSTARLLKSMLKMPNGLVLDSERAKRVDELIQTVEGLAKLIEESPDLQGKEFKVSQAKKTVAELKALKALQTA